MDGPAWLECSLQPSSNSTQASWGDQADLSPLPPMNGQPWSDLSRPLAPNFTPSVPGSAVTAATSGAFINAVEADAQDLADARPTIITYVLPNPPPRRAVQRQSVSARSVLSQAEPVSFSFSDNGESAWSGGFISHSVKGSEMSDDFLDLSTDLKQPDREPNTSMNYSVRREEVSTQDPHSCNWFDKFAASFDLIHRYEPHLMNAWCTEGQGRAQQDNDSFVQGSTGWTAVANQPPTVPQPVGGALRLGAAAARYNALRSVTKAKIPQSPGTSRRVVSTTSGCGRAYHPQQQLHPALAPAPARSSAATSELLCTRRPVGIQNSTDSTGAMSVPDAIYLRDELARLRVTYDLARIELCEANNYESQTQETMNEMYTLIQQCNAGSLLSSSFPHHLSQNASSSNTSLCAVQPSW